MNENDIANKVIGLAIEVHKTLGPGLLENTYKECLLFKLNETGLSSEKEKAVPLIYNGVKLDCGYRVDILVMNKLVLEIKSVEALNEIHFAQVLTYLRLGSFKLGLLMNFNELLLKDGIRRIINGVL